MKESRRDFLCRSAAALSMTALATQSGYFNGMSALAQRSVKGRSNAVPSDYRALVCIFLVGGNDGNNLIVPNHNDASISNYSAYSAARSAQGLALPQGSLLPIAVPRIGGLTYGLHPSLGTVTGGINPDPSALGKRQNGSGNQCGDIGEAYDPCGVSVRQCAASAAAIFSH
ncbi:MAG: hypothetical protein IPI76_14815 [Chloracidobacterium sp.]|nr:hypothetical protein [Chloracidobacterium sp.]